MAMDRTVKSAAFVLMLALSLAAWGQADDAGTDDGQDGTERASLTAFRELGIREKELDRIEAILKKDEAGIAEARAEIQIIQARIARELLKDGPDKAGIKAMIEESLGWELKIRMIQIERQIAIRDLIGTPRWALFVKLMRAAAIRDQAAVKSRLGVRDSALAERLNGAIQMMK